MDNAPIWALIVITMLGARGVYDIVLEVIRRRHKKQDDGSAVSAALAEVKGEIKTVREEIAADRATSARIRILCFSDEVRHKVRHSKEAFDQVNLDIDSYKKYCKEHPEYQNNRGQMAISNIERVYADCLKNNDFLE